MDCVGHLTSNFGTSENVCLFMDVSCVLACCAKPNQNTPKQIIVPKLSPSTPKKTFEKIRKSFIQCMCLTAKPQKELPPNTSKKFMKSNKAIAHMCLVMKKQQVDDNKCLWKKTILMGEKCQPLQFPGAIFYDNEGNQISELSRSPRATSP
ncbi:hypothetical protein RIF29_21061 [Crotalaria pallida]|uniref:Uncharacterized protein n=1 Tax=Crotalaria pallida TaxID=3830 RepID=A0AAN9F6N0_CROPI